MELGNVTIAELAYQKSKQYNKLTLLYLTIGRTAWNHFVLYSAFYTHTSSIG